MSWKEVIANEWRNRTNTAEKLLPLVDKTLKADDVINAVDVMLSGQLSMGPKVAEFERKFADYVGSNYAVMVNSGSSANLLAFYTLIEDGVIPKGSEILVPSICWSTTVAPIIQCGCRPVFVDIDPMNLNVDLNDLVEKITDRTAALFLVHVLGLCCDMNKLMAILHEKCILLIEDTCESLGSRYNYKGLGTFGIMGTYSFFYSHHITTGEGGMIVTNDENLYTSLLCMRAHGWTRNLPNRDAINALYPNIDSRFLFIKPGFNFRPMEISGALGISQLSKIETLNTNRNRNYVFLRHCIESNVNYRNQWKFTDHDLNIHAARFGFVVIMENDRNAFMQYLESHGIETRPIVSGDFTKQPVMIGIDGIDGVHEHCPNASKIGDCGFFIGLHSTIWTYDKVKKIVEIFYNFYLL